MSADLEEGLYFRTNREIYWNLPQPEGPRKRWTVPAGTRGVVRVDRSTREVGFAFDNMTHPECGLAPTQRKPGMPILDWMTPVNKMKGPHDQDSEFTPMPDSELPEVPEGFAAILSRRLAPDPSGPQGRRAARSGAVVGQSGAQSGGQGSDARGPGAARA